MAILTRLRAFFSPLGRQRPTKPPPFPPLNIHRKLVSNHIEIYISLPILLLPVMGKNSAGHVVRGLRGLFRPKAKPITRSSSPSAASAPPPVVSTPPPVASAPQTPPDPRKKTISDQETEDDEPHDRLLLDEEVKASIDAQEKLLLAIHKMSLVSYLMSDGSNELSEAMIEYGLVFHKRARADPVLSANQVEDNARFRCYTHASRFWGEMSAMQMAVHDTLVQDYQDLNRQAASFFEFHASDDVDDDKFMKEYDKMLDRVERLASFRLPEDLQRVKVHAPENSRRKPEYRKHSRSRSESASRSMHVHVPPRACPVSGFTHGGMPHSLESPAMYPGAFRHRWGEPQVKESQMLREASSGDQRLEALLEMRDDLMMSFAKKHNDGLRDLETDFLTRIAVGLTNTSFDRLKDAYRKADEWSSVVGLQAYADHLCVRKAQAEVNEPLPSSPPRSVTAPELIGDEWRGGCRCGFGADNSTNIAFNSGIGRAFSPGLFPGNLIEERAENEDTESESESESESNDPTLDDSTSPQGSEPGPDPPGGNNPWPPGGNSGSNSTGGPSASGYSNYSARGAGGSRNSTNSNSFSSYAGSGSSYEGNQRFSNGLQASPPRQIIYESSDNGSLSISSDSPPRSNCDSILSRSSLSTTLTSLGSAGDLSKSPKGSSQGGYALAMAQPVPGVAVTSVSPETGPAKAALIMKGGNRKLSGTTFGIANLSMGSGVVEGSGGAQAQNALVYPLVNPFEDTPSPLSTLLEDPDEGPADDYQEARTGPKHRHLRRVPRFIILQGGKLKVFGRHNSYTGTGLKTESPARRQRSLKGYQRLSSSASLPILPACEAVLKLAGDREGSDPTTSGPGSGLSYKNAGGQAAGKIPNKTQ
ncbi:hypothetical protein C7212DRAFT_342453 [Tuber magnatum]|uniref:Uncharacterized protein n=1 Tax=Tuber magnatum TaxID=42249 RepID=A0A317SW65_9PEZI|nr:hypothetical protein C7212DRAFT_342453 [Tuber magnatum]